VEVGVGDHRVLTHDVDTLDLAGLVSKYIDQLVTVRPTLPRYLASPCVLHLLLILRDNDSLVPGIHVASAPMSQAPCTLF